MYHTVIKHSSHLRTLEKCRKHSPAARVFYISLVFSNACRVLSQCNTRLRLLFLLSIRDLVRRLQLYNSSFHDGTIRREIIIFLKALNFALSTLHLFHDRLSFDCRNNRFACKRNRPFTVSILARIFNLLKIVFVS